MEFQVNEHKIEGELGETIEVTSEGKEWTADPMGGYIAGVSTPLEQGFYVKIKVSKVELTADAISERNRIQEEQDSAQAEYEAEVEHEAECEAQAKYEAEQDANAQWDYEEIRKIIGG